MFKLCCMLGLIMVGAALMIPAPGDGGNCDANVHESAADDRRMDGGGVGWGLAGGKNRGGR